MKKLFFALAMISPFTFPLPTTYGKSIPEQQVPDKKIATAEYLTQILLLADFTHCKTREDTLACAEKILQKAAEIEDSNLRRICVFSLAKIQKSPENLEQIRKEHLKKISTHFEESAFAARDAKRYNDALVSVQIALKCNPANANARLLFASLIEPQKAAQTLHYGVRFLDLSSEIAPVYFNKYFQTLSDLQQDRTVARQALSLLTEKKLPEPIRIVIANHAAMALYWFGSYENCLRIIEEQKLSNTQQGLILKSRALFDSKKNSEAIKLLENRIDTFPAEKRDAILAQLMHYYQCLGNREKALEIANRRVVENPDAPAPYLQRLNLYKKINDNERYPAEIASILEAFSSSQTALVSLANFATKYGQTELARNCLRLAAQNRFNPNIFAANIIECLITEGNPEDAVDTYIEIIKSSPHTFDGMESSINAILAAAYSKLAHSEATDEAQREPAKKHAELLISRYLEDKTLSPHNIISVIQLFQRIQENKFALELALAGTKRFPWHSELRANAISLRIKEEGKFNDSELPPLKDEIKTLINMRRPEPKIWKEIALWAATSPRISAEDSQEIRQLVAPLVRNDFASEL